MIHDEEGSVAQTQQKYDPGSELVRENSLTVVF